MSCAIKEVLAPNGNPSILYRDIARSVSSPAKAMEVYLSAKRMNAARYRVDANGEPLFIEVMLDLQDFSEKERARVMQERPDLQVGKTSPEIQSRLNQIDFQLQTLKRKLTNTTKEQERDFFAGRIEQLEADRVLLQDIQTAQSLETVATRQLNYAASLSRKKYLTDKELVHALQIADSWTFDVMREFLSDDQRDPENPLNILLQGISSRADAVGNELIATLQEFIRKDIEKSSGRPMDIDSLLHIEEIGIGKRKFLDLSRINSRLAKHIDQKLKHSSRDQAGKIKEISRILTELSQDVDASRLLATDKDGKPTGSLISQFSDEYYKKIKSATWAMEAAQRKARSLPSAEAERLLSRAMSRYYATRRKLEHTIDMRFFVEEGFSTAQHKSRKEYIAFLEAHYGKKAATEYIEQARSAYYDYKKEYDAAHERYEAEAISGVAAFQVLDGGVRETIAQFIDRRLREWDNAHSPINYLHESNSRRLAVYRNQDGWRFAVRIPLIADSKGVDLGNYNNDYANLNEKELALHRYILATMEEMKSYLPQHVAQTLNQNFLAVIQKDLVEQWQENGTRAALHHLNETLLESITSSTIAELNQKGAAVNTEIDPHTGRESKRVPIRFIHDNISQEDRSFDLLKLVEMFSAMAINYRFKTDVEDRVALAYRVLREAQEISKRGGEMQADRHGKLVTYKDGLVNLTSSVEYAINAMLYGEKRIEDEGISENVRLYDINPVQHARKKRQAKEIEAQRDALDEKLSKGLLEIDKYEATMKQLEDQYRSLGGRNLVWGKFLDGALVYTQLKGMGYNVTAGIANMGFGLVSNLIHASTGTDFTDGELLKASWITLKSRSAAHSKVAELVRKYNVLFEVTEIGYGKSAERRRHKMLSNLSPFEIQRRTEFILQGTSMVAQMLHTKVKDLEGKERTLWEAYDDSGNWNVAEFGEPGEWNDTFSTPTDNQFTRFRDKVIQVNKTLHGNYDPNSPIEIKKSSAGRALMMFRSWIAEGVNYRFGKEDFDEQMGRQIKGRWLSYRDVVRSGGWAELPKTLFNIVLRQGKGEKVAEIDYINMKANLREIQILISMMGAAILLKMAIGDDDDDDRFSTQAGRVLLHQLYRVEKDIAFYINPGTAIDLIKSPAAVIGTFSDFIKAYDNTISYLEDPEYRGAPPHVQWMKTAPLTNQLLKVQYQGTTDPSD